MNYAHFQGTIGWDILILVVMPLSFWKIINMYATKVLKCFCIQALIIFVHNAKSWYLDVLFSILKCTNCNLVVIEWNFIESYAYAKFCTSYSGHVRILFVHKSEIDLIFVWGFLLLRSPPVINQVLGQSAHNIYINAHVMEKNVVWLRRASMLAYLIE